MLKLKLRPFKSLTICNTALILIALIFSSLIMNVSSINAAQSSVTASSGSASAIQAAVNTVDSAGGGTVYIPAGTFNLGGSVTVPSNVTLIGAGSDKTIINTSGSSQRFNLKGNNARISSFSLLSPSHNGGNGIEVGNYIDFRIDHMHIEGYGDQGSIYIKGGNARGVIDHNYIKGDTSDRLNYGVVVYGSDTWNEDMQLGTQYAVFIEDNTFVNCRHSVAANAGAHYVFRYNLVQEGVDSQAVDAHGPYWGGDEGTRAIEVYGNIIESPESSGSERAICVRGGGGVVFDNTTIGYKYGVLLKIEDGQTGSSYPMYHQVHDLYIWDNSFDGSYDVGCSSLNNSSSYIKENRDWFAYALSGYTPYTYPHPLVSGSTTSETVEPDPEPTPEPITEPDLASSGSTFGLDSGDETYAQFGNALQAMRFQNEAGDGVIDNLSILFDDSTPSGNVRLGVYADANGAPGALLLDAGEATVQDGWVSITGLNLQVEPGAYYWLAYNLDETNGVRYLTDQPDDSHYRVNGYAYGEMPSLFPSGSLTNNLQYVLQASVIQISLPIDEDGGIIGLDSGDSTYNQHGGALQAMRFQNDAGDGAIDTLSILFDDSSPSGNVWLGVYEDDNGAPGTLLLDAGETTVQNGWVSITGLNLQVEPDVYYWLAYNLEKTNGVSYQTDQPTDSHYRVNGYGYGEMPAQFPSNSKTNNLQYVLQAGL